MTFVKLTTELPRGNVSADSITVSIFRRNFHLAGTNAETSDFNTHAAWNAMQTVMLDRD